MTKVIHRTDCITCKKRIYHAPIYARGNDQDTITFVGFDSVGGFVYRVAGTDHFLIVSRAGEYVVASCKEYDDLGPVMDNLRSLVALHIALGG